MPKSKEKEGEEMNRRTFMKAIGLAVAAPLDALRLISKKPVKWVPPKAEILAENDQWYVLVPKGLQDEARAIINSPVMKSSFCEGWSDWGGIGHRA